MIDEKKLIEEFEKENATQSSDLWHITGIKAFIENQPTVEAQPKLDNNLSEFGKWIPCSERLPNDREEKLVYLSSNRMTIAIYNEHILPHSGEPIGWGYEPHKGYIAFEEEIVIAWQPLPEPYKGEQK